MNQTTQDPIMLVLEQMGVPHDQVHQLNLTQFGWQLIGAIKTYSCLGNLSVILSDTTWMPRLSAIRMGMDWPKRMRLTRD